MINKLPLFPLSSLAAALLCFWPSSTSAAEDIPFGKQAVVRLATVNEGTALLGRPDRFVKAMSPFDRQVRLKAASDPGPERYRRFAAAQTREWTDDEKARLRKLFAAIWPQLQPFDLPWPEKIMLVKTNGREEGGAAYCRGAAIVLPEKVLKRDDSSLNRLLLHELFHILSSHNHELRDQLYAIIGFLPCKKVTLPDLLRSRKITNPDGPVIEHYIEITHDGRPLVVAPILFSSTERYNARQGGSLFSYLTFRLMVLEQEKGIWRPALRGGQPVLLEVGDTPSYHEKIGRNTKYIIHPDEIMADNFVMLVTGEPEPKTPRIIEEMRKRLGRL